VSFDAFFVPTLAYSYSAWTSTGEQTSLSFDEPHFLPTCECPFFTSLSVANRGWVSVSDWQKLIPMDSTSKSHFSAWRPTKVRGSELSIQHHAYPTGIRVETFHGTL
jgi:hypothetical protein